MFTYIYTYVDTKFPVHVYICMETHVYIYVYLYLYMCIYTYICGFLKKRLGVCTNPDVRF